MHFMFEVHHNSLSEPIVVAGLQIRTRNANELSGQGLIGNLWQRFFAENVAAQFPNRTNGNLYVVYSEYESDEYGEYNYLLGVPVSSINNLPAGMIYAAIPTGEYAIIKTEKGSVAEVVRGAWKYIWNMSTSELGGKREFLTDYEIYDERSSDPENAQVEIHLGLAPEQA
jgi:predicted transcriptional regulator YdeE